MGARADAGGRSGWVTAMQSGMSRDEVAHAFWYSTEHMGILVDGTPLRDRKQLSDPVRPDSRIHVLQALSGG